MARRIFFIVLSAWLCVINGMSKMASPLCSNFSHWFLTIYVLCFKTLILTCSSSVEESCKFLYETKMFLKCISNVYLHKFKSNQKDQIILALVWGILTDFWVPHEIDSWNFQHMLDLWFSEASQNLSSFRQLLFLSFQRGGPKGKIQKNNGWSLQGFWIFPFGPRHETKKIKVVKMSSNF